MSALAAEANRLLAELGVGPKKRFGQNFMIAETSLRMIAGALTVSPDIPILEIGPGLGFLTRYLLERGYRVTALEKDRDFAGSLEKRLNDPALRVVEGDILMAETQSLGLTGPFAVAANIPYNITTPILEWLIERRSQVQEAVLTIQKEVAERLLAKPGTKAWGSLTIFVRTFAEIKPVGNISRTAFLPPPNVDSAVIRIQFLKKLREDIGEEAVYFSLVRRAFQKRRKTLSNALEDTTRPELSRETLPGLLKGIGVDPKRRPETILLSEWAALSRRLSKSYPAVIE